MKKIYHLEVWIFCKMHDWIPFFLAVPSSMSAKVSNVFWKIKFRENVGKIWNYLRKQPTSTKYD